MGGEVAVRKGTSAGLTDKQRKAFIQTRNNLIGEQYKAFAYGAVEDMRRAMAGRVLPNEEALPLLFLWSAVARHCDAFEELVKEFCSSWCADAAGVMAAFDTDRGLKYVRATPMFPGRERLRKDFVISGQDASWVVLCSRREWETRRKSEQRARARLENAMPVERGLFAMRDAARRKPRKPKAEPIACLDGRPRGSKPWSTLGVTRYRWYIWSQEQRIEAAEAAGVDMPWLYPAMRRIKLKMLNRLHGNAFWT